jgi:hypothetical protein
MAADFASPPPDEQYGPLSLRRLRKQDGRALIVFAAASQKADDDSHQADGGGGETPGSTEAP